MMRWLFLFCVFVARLSAAEPGQAATTNSFPSPSEVFQGRVFTNEFDRSVFFLCSIHDHYPAQWPALLEANITVQDYVWSPEKLLRFIEELGTAMKGSNDLAASTNLALIISDKLFYANTNADRPEILQAAAKALIQIGPGGRKALASCFSEEHYRADPVSLEELAKIIGEERPADPELAGGLSAAAFRFGTADGGWYPDCTRAAVSNLLCLPGGVPAVRSNLNIEAIFDNPGRYQAVVDGIAAARAVELATNLAAIETNVSSRVAALTNSPGAYVDDLKDLDTRVRKTLEKFESAKPTAR